MKNIYRKKEQPPQMANPMRVQGSADPQAEPPVRSAAPFAPGQTIPAGPPREEPKNTWLPPLPRIVIGVLVIAIAGAVLFFLLTSRKSDVTPATPSVIEQDASFPNSRGATTYISVCVPNGVKKAPLVVMCHGFTGARDGNGHFAPLARELADDGIASVRLDFAGHGQNDAMESTAAYSLSGCASDISDAIDWMRDNYHVDTSNIAMVGHSMGGRIVSWYVQTGEDPANSPNRYAGAVKGIALWSPADGDGVNGLEFLDIGDPAHVQQLRNEAYENGVALLPSWGNFQVSRQLFEESDAFSPSRTLPGYSGRILLTYTENEMSIFSEQTVQSTIAAVQASQNAEVVPRDVFALATHNYISLDYDVTSPLSLSIDEVLRRYTVDRLLLPVLLGREVPEATPEPPAEPAPESQPKPVEAPGSQVSEAA